MPGSSDVLTSTDTMFGVFHEVFGKNRSVMVRGYDTPLMQSLKSKGLNHSQSQVWIRKSIPQLFELAKLGDIIGDFHVRWNSSPSRNVLRDSTNGSFVELFLDRDDMRKLIGHQVASSQSQDLATSVNVLDCHLGQWVQQEKANIIGPGTGEYVPAAIEEMLYMDEEIVAPLVRMICELNDHDRNVDDFWTKEKYSLQLQTIHAAARIVGYRVQLIRDRQTSRVYIALSESNQAEKRGWGTFVFRVGAGKPYAVEIPRPLYEFRSFDFGNNLFSRTDAAALLIAGAHPRANRDGTADISDADNRTNLYNLVRHILFREFGTDPLLVIQARAIQAPVDADIIVATDEGRRNEHGLSSLKQSLLEQLREDDLKIAFVDGSEHTAGYEIGILLQATMVQISGNKEVVSLWLSPALRSKFREQTETDNLSAQFDACGLVTIEDSLWSYLSALNATGPDGKRQPTTVPAELRSELKSYTQSNDIVKLTSIVSRYSDWHFQRLLDVTSGQAYLLVKHDQDSLPSVMNLTGFIGDQTKSCSQLSQTEVESFVRSRAMWLEIESL